MLLVCLPLSFDTFIHYFCIEPFSIYFSIIFQSFLIVCVCIKYSSLHIYDWFDGRSDKHYFMVDLCICCYRKHCHHRCTVVDIFWCTQDSRCQDKILLFWGISAKWNNDLCHGNHSHRYYGKPRFMLNVISTNSKIISHATKHFSPIFIWFHSGFSLYV